MQCLVSRKSKLMENAYTYAKNANDALNLAGLTGVADPARIWGNQRQQTKRWHCEKSVKFLCVFNYFGFFEVSDGIILGSEI